MTESDAKKINVSRLNPELARYSDDRLWLESHLYDNFFGDFAPIQIKQSHFSVRQLEDYDGNCMIFVSTAFSPDNYTEMGVVYPLMMHQVYDYDRPPITVTQLGFSKEFLQNNALIRYPLSDERRQTVFTPFRHKTRQWNLDDLIDACMLGEASVLRLAWISVAPNFLKFSFADTALPQLKPEHLPNEIRHKMKHITEVPLDIPDIELVIPRTGEYELEFLVNQPTTCISPHGQQIIDEFNAETKRTKYYDDPIPDLPELYAQPYRIKSERYMRSKKTYLTTILYGAPRLRTNEMRFAQFYQAPERFEFFGEKEGTFLELNWFLSYSRYPVS